MTRIRASDVSKSYGQVTAVRDLNLEVEEGEIAGLIGPNGAGKSTAVQVLTGQESRDSGEVEVLGLDPSESAVEIRARAGILPEREDPPSFLTVSEYMDYVSEVRGSEIDRGRWLERMRLEGKEEKLTVDLSKGERQKLMVIQALFHEPEAAFIDEPLINLDPVVQEEVKDLLKNVADRGGSVLLSTHVVSLAEEICDRVYVMEDGETREVDNVDNLLEEFQ